VYEGGTLQHPSTCRYNTVQSSRRPPKILNLYKSVLTYISFHALTYT
jgi:hypothetical protein